MSEPVITVNGRRLPHEQARLVRIAVKMLFGLSEKVLGADEGPVDAMLHDRYREHMANIIKALEGEK